MDLETEHFRTGGLKTSIPFFSFFFPTNKSGNCSNNQTFPPATPIYIYTNSSCIHTSIITATCFDIYETGTTIRSTSGAYAPSTPATLSVLPVPLFKLKVILATPVICPLPVGTKAILCVTPLTVMSANRCVVSPFVYLILMVVLVVAEEEIPLKVSVSPAEPPM
jgi:hypothetical protein